jgi:threonine dehydratase
VKIEATRALGAEVVLVTAAERHAAAEDMSARRGYTLIPPYDHPDVIAGQGTVGLEIIQDLPTVDVVLVPVGGGGLASGVATAVRALAQSAVVIGVEPELAADAAEGFQAGKLAAWPVTMTGRTVADGLRTNLSELTLAHLKQRLDDIVTVSEDQILAATRALALSARLVAEPSGAVSVAAYLYEREKLPPGQVAAIISGGNIDPGLLVTVIGGGGGAPAGPLP